jgi:hypothetical protein
MGADFLSRRAVLKSLGMGAVAGSVLRVIPLEAAAYAHSVIDAEKADTGVYAPKFFDAHGYKTLQSLCETIFPADADSGGAVEAGAPEFIDLVTSENAGFQEKLGGGLKGLDAACMSRYGKAYLECAQGQQKEILDSIAYRKNAEADAGLAQGGGVFLAAAEPDCGWIFHEQDWDQVSGVQGEHICAGVSGVSAGAGAGSVRWPGEPIHAELVGQLSRNRQLIGDPIKRECRLRQRVRTVQTALPDRPSLPVEVYLRSRGERGPAEWG